jgi:hypothetical protein
MKHIEVKCECGPKKLSIFDEVFLKDGTSGIIVDFDNSPLSVLAERYVAGYAAMKFLKMSTKATVPQLITQMQSRA